MELEETAEEITLAYVCFDYSSICFWERHLSTQVLLDHLPSLFDLHTFNGEAYLASVSVSALHIQSEGRL